MPGIPSFEFGIETIALASLMVLLSGILAMLISRKTKFPYTPLLVLLGVLVGPVLTLILPQTARMLFYYVRAFGLFLVLFAAGFSLRLAVLKEHKLVITLLDTIGLLGTAILAGWFFSWAFGVPFPVGFLFGAVVSGTDPATLIPLFQEHKVPEDVETVIITEAIFNGPLAIILTMVALFLIIPEIPGYAPVEPVLEGAGLYVAAIVYFLYQIFVSAIIGAVIAYIAYQAIVRLGLYRSPYTQILGLAMAFGGYVVGEFVGASGFLVVTIIGLILGNHRDFFKRKSSKVDDAVERNMEFNDVLSTFSVIFIFVLLGASLDLTDLQWGTIATSLMVALFVIFVARPLASLVVLPFTGFKRFLFISLEGPKGAVAASMAILPVVLGRAYNSPEMIAWGELILSAGLMTVLLSMLLESAWVSLLRERLLD
ncbi:cation:proton antiporter [Thermococcus radiotolerans]|uniref:Sodium:proton antiporter n=1 Tax=Thermococcus radiotolerans TaxID=187880 RepID=A0A2Z2N0H5_9EURY|nr:cation:proton antiporter [Thermococcus radiotolerans]ASJ13940.1 sodium:proton antiporter [Thermococcus radiotolerans]